MTSPVGTARRLRPGTLAAIAAALLAIALVGVAVGPVSMGVRGVALGLLDRLPLVTVDSGLTRQEAAVLWELRVPRVVLGGLVGGTLALAGASYQGVFRNPLADPYLLGVAAGAGLGATVAIGVGVPAAGWLLPLAAFAGALVGVGATYSLARIGGPRRTATLILAGVAVASFMTAAQTFIQQLTSDTIREVFSWILGRLTTVGWSEVGLLLPFVAVAGTVLLAHGRHLDVLAVGEEEASSLGLPAERVRLLVVLAATLATAAAVGVSGLIGFVGIVVPHAVRRITGAGHRVLLPVSFLVGAGFMMGADILARTIIAPTELPIGVITAFVGAPFFGLILYQTRQGRA
jgi:iron complex transport system permease protein